MRISRIYQHTPLSLDSTVELNEWAIQHTVIALRLKPGFIIHLFNGIDAGEYQAELIALSRRDYAAKILAFIPRNNESPLKTHLGQCISRGDRMDFALQKAVELGVTEITPLISDYGAVKLTDQQLNDRMRHWQHILISAAEQSERCLVPRLNPVQPLAEFVTRQQNAINIVFHPGAPCGVDDLPLTAESVSLLIGPEGGFSEREVALTQQQQFSMLNMGPRVVRTETATVLALTLLQHRWGDLKPPLSELNSLTFPLE